MVAGFVLCGKEVLDLNKLKNEAEEWETRHLENSFVWWGFQMKERGREMVGI